AAAGALQVPVVTLPYLDGRRGGMRSFLTPVYLESSHAPEVRLQTHTVRIGLDMLGTANEPRLEVASRLGRHQCELALRHFRDGNAEFAILASEHKAYRETNVHRVGSAPLDGECVSVLGSWQSGRIGGLAVQESFPKLDAAQREHQRAAFVSKAV